ncbi:MAG: type III pantothenate kinase [Clostridia bacterium]|nr:type III pantothenate kinase [Clostridia bacterium]
MILTIDVGNTNITCGGFDGSSLNFVVRMSTRLSMTEDEYASKILSILKLHNVEKKEIKGAIISSVVPPLNAVMKKAVKLMYGVDALVVGPGIKTGLNIHCDNPSSVGSDLICACVAANKLYGSPSLIIDMGTATKMTVLNKNGAFEGVSIIPGVMMGLDALAEKTAQLPKISLEAPGKVIGKNTVDCMKSGVVFGNAALIDGMIDRINSEMNCKLPVIATGGLAQIIIPHCTHNILVDEYLVLKGLELLYRKNS